MLFEKEKPFSSKTCKTCKFFELRTGFCRKNPPNVLLIPTNNDTFINSVFPKIGYPELDWCGEW